VTCSTSSSDRRRNAAIVWLFAATLACSGASPQRAPLSSRQPVAELPPEVPAGGRAARIALLPPQNLTGLTFDEEALSTRFEQALARAGLDVVSGALVDAFLASRRIRFTGGLDREDAVAAGEALDVRGVLVTSVVQRDEGSPPRLAVLARLVSVDDDPSVYWMDGVALSGEDNRGLLELRLVHRLERLERRAFARLSESLVEFLDGERAGGRRCSTGRRYRPSVAYRNIVPPKDRAVTVAVVPFQNKTRRDHAGEVASLQLTRALAGVRGFRVLEPAVVREEMLRRRIVVQEGVSRETVRMLRGGLEVDYVVGGMVSRYDEARGKGGIPAVDVTVTMIETATGRVAWHSRSEGRGDDGVVLFDLGTVRSTEELSCRLLGQVANGLSGGR
jgi:TolB-like protein